MGIRGDEFTFFQGIHVRIDIRIDISISTRPMITKFGKQVHLQDLTQMRLKFDSNGTNQAGVGDVITSRPRNKLRTYCYQSACGHQT